MDHTNYGVAKNGAIMKVELTEKEANICNLLQGVSSFIAKERPELPLIESRIAGGWVRDKVMKENYKKKERKALVERAFFCWDLASW
jgi:tRNA nucleotidyltransferase (CCA-adding enzyme)